MTRLNAINACLRGIGLAPVATEDDPDLDAAIAGQTIDQVSTNIQSRGWWFNKEYNWKISPDPITGYIPAPSSVMSIISSGVSRDDSLSIRAGLVYDLWNHTHDLRPRVVSDPGSSVEYIEFAFITRLAFNDLPPIAQQAIAYTARREFAQDLEVDEKRWKFQMQDEQMAMMAMLREDTRSTKRNNLRDNAAVASFLNQVGGVNSRMHNLSNLGNFPKRNS